MGGDPLAGGFLQFAGKRHPLFFPVDDWV